MQQGWGITWKESLQPDMEDSQEEKSETLGKKKERN